MITLNESEIHVWKGDLKKININLSAVLSDDENIVSSQKKIQFARMHYIQSRIFLRLILSMYLSCDPRNIQFGQGENKKPFVSNLKSDLFFNLSHTNHDIACAVTRFFPVGIDIESRGRRVSFSVADRYFHFDERSFLSSCADQQTSFLEIWTRKEAILKALGLGISLSMNSFSVLPLSLIQLNWVGNTLYLETQEKDGLIFSVASLECRKKWVFQDYHAIF